ncbi:MAG: T9SS type A sorting domain-containing protein [Bacteroidetes bacterium]|nr:T9SS type A sorting domain-containing protein [Bacteroidota bacterium]
MQNYTHPPESFLEKYFAIMVIVFFIIFLSVIVVIQGFSQQVSFPNASAMSEYGGEYPIGRNDANNPCITPEQYKIIEKQNIDNCKLLGIHYGMQQSKMTTTFIWPLKTANGLNDCSYYYIGNYLDQDTTSPGIKDWNCGSVTYDGHKGTDICTYPYPFYKMDNNQVEIIAAAPGTIINRVDGNFDKNCNWNNPNANYITIQHADGSVAMYWHMKMNSLTAKTIGQTVVAGEYLGVVGSSGSSSAPHLHFEVLSGITLNTLNDSYSGPCNTLNGNSWWAVQKPYTEPAIIQASVHPVLAVFPACPATETPNEDTCFAGGTSAKFYIFMRNETAGKIASMRIINPNGTTFTSWTHNSNNTYLASYWISTKTLPATAGTYTYEAVYNGDTCRKSFMINCNTDIAENNFQNNISVYPNPSNGKFTFFIENEAQQSHTIEIYNMLGEKIFSMSPSGVSSGGGLHLNLSDKPNGIYFLEVKSENGTITKKIIKD